MRGRVKVPRSCVRWFLMEPVQAANPIPYVHIPSSPTPRSSKGVGDAGGDAGVAAQEDPVGLDDALVLDLAQPL